MSARPRWSYVQARLQARHGERLDEDAWRALDAARSVEEYLERSRATALRRFTDALAPRMSSHVIERMLRAAWRAHVAEVATWVAPAWQAAVRWTAYLPDLALIRALLEGKAPDWARQDPALAALCDAGPERAARLERSPLAALAATDARSPVERWLAAWQAAWPAPSAAERRSLDEFVRIATNHFERLAQASLQDRSGPYRRDLATALARAFRRTGATPAAVFCHLALVALDLERLRGGLVRRRLFGPDHAREAA